MSVQNLKIRLHILSPVHIGCDDVYEPTSFVIDEQNKKLIEFDPMDFVKALSQKEREEFSKKCTGDNLLDIIKFTKRTYKPALGGKHIDIANGLLEHYKRVLSMSTFEKKAVINQFTINKTAYNSQNNQPYIPGSSLKGSLRTAYLSALANVKEETKWNQKADDLETKLLDRSTNPKEKISSDPFRMVKVSDLLPVGDVKTKIVYAINRKKEKSDKATLAEKGGVYQIFETIQSGAIFGGIINVDSPIEGSKIMTPIKPENLLLSVHKFYAGNLKQEIKPLNDALGIKHQAGISANAQFQDKFKQSAFLIRLGRHSGAEAVTIEGNRSIKIKGKDNDFSYKDHATTLWLAADNPKPENNNGLLPFGWAVMEIIDGH